MRNQSFLKILVVIGVLLLLGVGLYRLSKQGRLPFNIPNDVSLVGQQNKIQNNETRVVVSEETAVISAVEKASPSVVAIGLNSRLPNTRNPFSTPDFQNNTIGTGFIVSAEKGIIVTNRHVVSDLTSNFTVVTKDGKQLQVQKIYRDPNLDMALVQVSGAEGLTPLEIGDSSNLKSGQLVIAIGNALGRFDNTVTTGVVSGLGRAVFAGDPFSGTAEQLDDLIQTDAAINPGNSGGPLLNSQGQVIGVNVATTEGAQNIGFAIPINSVKAVVDQFVANGFISRPYMGISYTLISRDVALLNNVPQGAFIREVIPGSPAELSGIQEGDIITKIDGNTVDEANEVPDIIKSKKVGDSLNLEVWSENQTVASAKNITLTLAESPNQ